MVAFGLLGAKSLGGGWNCLFCRRLGNASCKTQQRYGMYQVQPPLHLFLQPEQRRHDGLLVFVRIHIGVVRPDFRAGSNYANKQQWTTHAAGLT